MTTALLTILAGIWLLTTPPLTGLLLRRLKMNRPNYCGDAIPVGFGLAILLWAIPALMAVGRYFPDRKTEFLAMATLVAGFGILGFVDDCWGDRTVGGLLGHLRKFVIEGEITTGFLKLAGGALIAFVVPWRMLHHAWTDALIEGAVIALCANALNLLDLRPGRAGAIFIGFSAGALALGWTSLPGPPPLLFVLIPALVVYERDARARVMLGDTGSNALGAALGAGVVLLNPSISAEAFIVACLLLLHMVAEKWSLTEIIESNPILRALDRLTGKREAKHKKGE